MVLWKRALGKPAEDVAPQVPTVTIKRYEDGLLVSVPGELVRHHDAEFQAALDSWRGLTEGQRLEVGIVAYGSTSGVVIDIVRRLLKVAAR